MKNTVKKIIAFILCAVTLFGASQSAFATDVTGCITELPYEYNEDGDFYYLNDENYDYSYNHFYDEVAPAAGMFIDEVQIPFEYEGKKWLIQLWKGQYGMILLGSDIAVMTADKTADGLEDYSFVTDDDRLEIKLQCSRKNGTEFEELFSFDSAKHCFANGYSKGKLTDYTSPLSELKTYAEITFKSEEMAILFANGLDNAGFHKREVSPLLFEDCFYRDGSKVVLYWGNVYHSVVNVQNLSIDCAELSLRPDEKHQFTVEPAPADAIENNISWASSNEDVATVDENGVVTAHTYGSATITSTAESGVCANCYVTVKDNSFKYSIFEFTQNIIIFFIRISSLFTF